MLKKYNLILGILAAFLLLGSLWYRFSNSEDGSFSFNSRINPASLFLGNTGGVIDFQNSPKADSEDYVSEYNGSVRNNRFYHKGFGFSFALPRDFEVQQLPYGEGFELIAVEKNSEEGFQISIIPFDEAVSLSPERIWVDLPDKTINTPKAAKLDGVPILIFNSIDTDIGDTFEIWFSYDGHLYQILTYRYFASQLSQILDTWKFE